MIVELRHTIDKYHLLIWLKDEETMKKTPEKKSKKKVGEEVVNNESESSSEFDDVFYADYFAPQIKIHKKPKRESAPMF